MTMDHVISEGLVALVGSIISLLIASAKAFKFVQEGEQGCKLQFGKVRRDASGQPVIINPGFVFLIPWVETLRRRHVRQQTLNFHEQEIFIKENLVFIVSAIVRFRVVNIYKALFEVDDLDGCINDRCMGILRDVLQEKSYDEMRDTEAIAGELIEKMRTMEEEWGVEFLDTRLTSCAPSKHSEQIVSTKTSAQIKAHAVKDAADILGVKSLAAPGLLAAIIGVPVATSASSPAFESASDHDDSSSLQQSHHEAEEKE